MQPDTAVTLPLDGALTIARAQSLVDLLAHALEGDRPLRIDCGQAVEIDLSVIQVLISAARSAARRGLPVAIDAPRDGVLHAALVRGGFAAPDDDAAAAILAHGHGATGGTP
ncbi:MAG: lipid asymmetry maintenance protein MlaB [Rhodospirillales bacterium]